MFSCQLSVSIFVALLVFFIYFFLDMESIVLDSQDPSKQKWTPAEDIKLVEALVEYHQEREGSP